MKLLDDLAAYVISMHAAKIKKATKFIQKNLVLKITLPGFKFHHGGPGRGKTVDARLTVGRPNYAERKFIKDCEKAGEKFPVKRVQFKHFTKK